jgi:hypothetical protein
MKETEWVRWSSGPVCKRQEYEARIARHVPLRADDEVYTTLIEVWQRDKKGEQVYHNSFVTDLEVTKENLSEIISIGRAKWKIENEQFNVQKNHGYHLEHNFGHGKKNLSGLFYYLNTLAFIVHLILEMGSNSFRRVIEEVTRASRVWNEIRTLINHYVWESFDALLLHMLSDEIEASP